MTDEVVTAAADAAPVEKPDFEASQLHTDLRSHIDQFGSFAVARLHQLVDEMIALLK